MSKKLLDSQVSDYHILEIADDLVDWELMAPYLELSEADQKVIAENFRGRYELQKLEALRMWRRKCGDKATYRNLGSICRSQGRTDLADRIEEYPGSRQRPRSSEVLVAFQRHAINCFLNLPHPALMQWPESNPSLSFHTPSTFFDLVLHEAPLTDVQPPTNKSSLPGDPKPVALTSILKGERSQRMVVYFKGIGGSGKTTLSWHTCREWAEKRLLHQFQLLIHVQISNPRVKSATNFADLIPYPDKHLQQAVATAIVDQRGKGVCLLLDGLDEAPTELLNFLLVDLLQGRFGYQQLPELSFVITSRPDWRVTKGLKPVVSSCIELVGFNRDSLKKFLDHSLGAGSEQKAKLMAEFQVNPAVEGLCCHPVNAAIMSYVIHFISTVPTTQTKLHDALIKNFLVRHVDSRVKAEEPCEIVSLLHDSCLHHEICDSFRKMCLLAYKSVLNMKRFFTASDLEEANVRDTLGLLDARSVITMFGSRQYHSFYHISVQEFLAAVHLSTMKGSEQINAIKNFLGNNLIRSQVLSFYAGLTNLANSNAFQTISEGISHTMGYITIVDQLLEAKSDPRQKAVAFLRCLYECQNELLMRSPDSNLPLNWLFDEYLAGVSKVVCLPPSSVPLKTLKTLTLHRLTLTPLDCLSLGYYIRSKLKYALPEDSKITSVYNMTQCSITEVGLCLLLTEIAKDVTECTQTQATLILTGNRFNRTSLVALKNLLQSCVNINSLLLRRCFDPAIVDLRYALKCLTEGLASNFSCSTVDLSANRLNYSHIYHIVLMVVTCPRISFLVLRHNDLSQVMSLFSHAIALTSLVMLDLGDCNISDSHLEILGENIQNNRHLHALRLPLNKFTLAGLCRFLCLFKYNLLSRLTCLEVEHEFIEHHRVKQISREINWFRSMLPYPCQCFIMVSDRDISSVYDQLLAIRAHLRA